MRNLKRALSLALASVMLLGMMVVGSSAAFADADEIVNTEAVEITAGLGLFAGSDGKFNPKGNVTRAQMATVIVKMLYGSEINADQYKGSSKFSDIVAFEGGWAEGYINLCANLGIVGGYGDGSFKPGNSLTTAEAVTMIINALGIDAGKGTWPMTVMAKAEEIELFEDMAGVKPGTNVALTRDQLAVMVWNGLNYSADGVQGYKVLGSSITFKSWSDAAAYADAAYGAGNWTAAYVSEVKNDTLAETVFEIESAMGFITANQATGEDYTVVAGLNVNLETGLDQLGHFVTVYYKETYKNENKPGVAYCVVEEADYVKVAETISADKKDYLAAFGTKVDSVTNPILLSFNNAGYYMEYAVDEAATSTNNVAYAAAKPTYSKTAFSADAGTYVIDNETGSIIAFVAPTASTIDTVNRVTTTAGKESIKLSTTLLKNTEDEDEVVEYDGIAEDDIVVVKNYLGMTYLEKPQVVTGKITKTGTIDSKAVTYIDGTSYVNGAWSLANTNLSGSYTPDANKTYDAYLYNGKLIGVALTAGAASLDNVIYVVNSYTATNAGTYGTDTDYYYAQGVDASGKEVNILIGIEGCSEKDPSGNLINTPVQSLTANKFYTFEKSTDKEQAKKDVMVATQAVTSGRFDVDVDEFFGDSVTVGTGITLAKTDKYLTTAAGNKAYLTADTKFIVVEKVGGTTDELEIATYTGTIAKDVASGDLIDVAVSEDENGNKLAEIVVIYAAALNLKAEDYIYVVDGSDYSVVEGGYEYNVYFSATNEFKAIVADGTYATGFYGDYTIDEDGIYDLNSAASDNVSYVFDNELITGVFGTSIDSAKIDVKDAAEAEIVDVRGESVLENSEVAEIASLKDIASALKAGYRVYVGALLEDEGTDKVVTHIFVTSVQVEDTDAQGNGLGTWSEA